MLGSGLQATIRRAERAVLASARRRIGDCKIFSFGAVDIDPKHLAIWLQTSTDDERDALRRDPTFDSECREALRSAGYPEAAIAGVGVAIQSQQTVDRDFDGNWWYAVK